MCRFNGGEAEMRLGTCFSGIGAPELAVAGMGWSHVFTAEVEPFPSSVLAARFPGVPNLGDVTKVDWSAWRGKVDVMVGGPPCQEFSVAGKRAGIAGPRGSLSLRWVEVLDAVDPRWSVAENVPGWLSMRDNGFGTFLGALVGGGAPFSRQAENGNVRVLLLDPDELPRGVCSTLNTSECPNGGAVSSSLPDVLETGPIPSRYYLSAKACAGILRRAERRGKKLPEHLESILMAVAEMGTTP